MECQQEICVIQNVCQYLKEYQSGSSDKVVIIPFAQIWQAQILGVDIDLGANEITDTLAILQ